jgi:putative transcriptional regulator
MIIAPSPTLSPALHPPAYAAGLKGHLLVAMPGMHDPRFVQSIMLICHHDHEGALGLVLNRISDFTLHDLCVQMELPHDAQQMLQLPVHIGGPMDTHRGFLLHADPSPLHQKWQHSLPIMTSTGQTLHLTTSLDGLQAIAQDQGPEPFIFALGYAGWSAGQLEKELADNVWLTLDADPRLLFETAIEQRWQQAFQSLGFQLANFCPTAGHA